MRIPSLLYRLTANRPCRRIDRSDTQRYLERYWLGKLAGATFYLHRFVAHDADRWVHDHPWRWSLAIVLCGSYREERLRWWSPFTGWQSLFRTIGGWRRINLLGPASFHRIASAQPETWTLFIHGPRVPNKGWGFLYNYGDDTVYRQPFDIERSADWEKDVPVGCMADRAPLGGGS